jgi:hypothetical protein
MLLRREMFDEDPSTSTAFPTGWYTVLLVIRTVLLSLIRIPWFVFPYTRLFVTSRVSRFSEPPSIPIEFPYTVFPSTALEILVEIPVPVFRYTRFPVTVTSV